MSGAAAPTIEPKPGHVDGVRAEEDETGDEAGERDQDRRGPDEDARDDRLRDEQPASRHRPHEQVAEVAPARVARDRVAREHARDHDEQEPAHHAQHRGRNEVAALLREPEQALALVAAAAPSRRAR